MLTSDLQLKDNFAVLDELLARDIYQLRIFDMREHGYEVSYEHLQAITLYAKQLFRKPNRAAFIVADDSTYGRIRQLMVFREEINHSKAMVFRDENEAVEWLKAEELEIHI